MDMDIQAGVSNDCNRKNPKEEFYRPEPHSENSEDVWFEALQLLKRKQMSTYAMLFQWGFLQQVSEHEVHISLVNETILKMVKNNQAKIEDTFSQVLGRRIRVVLDVLELDEPSHKTMPISQERNLVEELTELEQDFQPCAEAAWNPDTPTEKLTQLAGNESEWVRGAVGGNPKTSPEALAQLARDVCWRVRLAVARNRNAPEKVLIRLAWDMNGWVREAVAYNLNTPRPVLAKLACDTNGWVRAAVAENPKTTTKMLSQLARDNNKWIRSVVAKNPQTPLEVLCRLAQDASEEVRREVARNPKIPTEVLTHLAQDVDLQVCMNVAKNPRTPVEGMNRLAQKQTLLLRREILEGLSKRPVESLCELAEQANSDLAQLIVELHKQRPLPLQVFQAGMRGKQSRLFSQALDESSSIYVLKEALSLLDNLT